MTTQKEAQDGQDQLSDEFMAAAALASLDRVKAHAFAARIDENLRKYSDLPPGKRRAFEQTRDWLRES